MKWVLEECFGPVWVVKGFMTACLGLVGTRADAFWVDLVFVLRAGPTQDLQKGQLEEIRPTGTKNLLP